MAMIRTYRLFPVLFALLLVTFSTAPAQRKGKGTTTSGKKTPSAMATVNGQKIPYQRYLEMYRDQVNHLRTMGQDTTVDLATADGIFMQLVDDELIRQEAAKLKIVVTRDQAMKLLLNNPPDFIRQPFIDQKGNFYKEVFEDVVQNPEKIAQLVGAETNRKEVVEKWRTDVEQVVRYVQTQELRRRLGETLYSKKPLTGNQIKHRYFAERTAIVGSFIRVLHSTIPDSLVPVTEEETRAWYRSHQDDYRFASARHVSSVILPVLALPSDSAAQQYKLGTALEAIEAAPIADRPRVIQNLVRGLRESRFSPNEFISLARIPESARKSLATAKQGDVIGPFHIEGERVLMYVEEIGPTRDTVFRARHLLIKPGDLTQDSLVYGLLSGLRDSAKTEQQFIEFARMYGQDGAAAQGGDLGYFSRGTMVEEFDSAVAVSPAGRAIGPIKTRFGQHLIWVSERVTTGYRLRELRFPLIVSPQAAEAVTRDAMLYADALRTGKVSADSLLMEIKARHPGTVADTSLLRRMDLYGDALGITNFAFGAKQGDVAVIRLPFDRIGVVQLLRSWPAGVAEYDHIRYSYVIPHVRRAKQLEMLRPAMQTLRDSMTPQTTLGIIRLTAPMAEAFMLENQNVPAAPDEDPTLLDSLVAVTPNGGVTGPVQGIHGYYFVRVQEKTMGPSEADYLRERESFTTEYVERYREQLIADMLKKARDYAELVDQRPVSVIVSSQ